MDWETDERMPRYEDRHEFEVMMRGQAEPRTVRVANNEHPLFAPGTWFYTDCTNPHQNMLANYDDITAWRIAAVPQKGE